MNPVVRGPVNQAGIPAQGTATARSSQSRLKPAIRRRTDHQFENQGEEAQSPDQELQEDQQQGKAQGLPEAGPLELIRHHRGRGI